MLKKGFGILFILTFFYVNLYSEAKHRLKKDFGPRVVGGKNVSVEQYPHSIQFFNLGAMCGGVILNSWTLLTSAHCLENNRDIDEMVVQIGARHMYDVQAKMHNLQHFVVHEDYNKRIPFSNDIAILFVKKPIQFSKRAKKAILVDNNRWMSPKEKKFVVTGRGLTQFNGSLSDQIKMAVLKYVPAQECSRLHDLELSPDMFCLYGDGKRDTCRGDSGGGVLWRGSLVGLTSHGDGCAKKNKPSVYTNLWYFRHWIKKEMSKFVKLYCRRQNKKKLKRRNKKSKNML